MAFKAGRRMGFARKEFMPELMPIESSVICFHVTHETTNGSRDGESELVMIKKLTFPEVALLSKGCQGHDWTWKANLPD